MKKFMTLVFALIVSVSAWAQSSLTSIYGLSSDTLTLAAATGTVVMTTPELRPAPASTTTVRFKITEYSGTTAGTATLMGAMSANGDYKALTTPNTVTALATHTVADATSAVYDWIIDGSPYPYLRVSWTATTATFSAKIEAQVFRSK